MKKKFLEFSNAILSRNQMKEVKGGQEYWEEGGMGSCTLSCTVGSITKSCTSTSGHCSSIPYGAAEPWIRCDNDAKLTC